MVTIATLHEPAKAKGLKERFQAAGVPVDIHNESHLQQAAFMSRPQANVKLQVNDDDFERAQALMVEWEATDPDIAAAIVRCPQCNSSSIDYPQLSRKSITPGLAGVLFALRMFPKEFYCENCHYTWSNQDQPALAKFWHRFFPGPEGASSARPGANQPEKPA